jgi:hypothetical protein
MRHIRSCESDIVGMLVSQYAYKSISPYRCIRNTSLRELAFLTSHLTGYSADAICRIVYNSNGAGVAGVVGPELGTLSAISGGAVWLAVGCTSSEGAEVITSLVMDAGVVTLDAGAEVITLLGIGTGVVTLDKGAEVLTLLGIRTGDVTPDQGAKVSTLPGMGAGVVSLDACNRVVVLDAGAGVLGVTFTGLGTRCSNTLNTRSSIAFI